MDDLAQAHILDHYKQPRNRGGIEQPTVSAEEHNPMCGDRVRMELLLADDVIQDLRWSGRGCTISQAAASMLAEELHGKPVEAAQAFTNEDMLELIGIPIGYARMKCALLGLRALKGGLEAHQGAAQMPEGVQATPVIDWATPQGTETTGDDR